MKVALCCIGRMENQYAREFVEHYKKLGFNKIFIYDNNHDGEEHFEDVLQDYIDEGLVDIIDYRNIEKAQLKAYNDCYQKHGNEYDWIAFFDFDEFLILEKCKSIKTFLMRFKNQQCILVNWMVMDDNGLITNDHRPLMERFTHPMDYDKKVMYSFPENNHVKSIVRGGIEELNFGSTPHIPSSRITCCDAIGNWCDSSPFKKYTFKGAYIKHFLTKTLEEWIDVKLKRGTADRDYNTFRRGANIDTFFKFNEKTDEKEKYIESLNNKDIVDIFVCTHKPFSSPIYNNCYKIAWAKKITYDLTGNGLKDDFYSELYPYKYIYDKIEPKKYIGFCHYRRYFSFLNDIPNLDELFSQYDCIVPKPIVFKQTVRQQYAILHNIEDLYIIGGIIAEKYPSYVNSWNNFLNGNIFIPYNMFIMKKDDFKKYIEFIFGVLDEYVKIVGTDIKKRIEDNKEKYLKDFYPNNTVEYQYRIGGYIGERLTNVFLMNNFTKMKTYPIIITEDKYKQNKKDNP